MNNRLYTLFLLLLFAAPSCSKSAQQKKNTPEFVHEAHLPDGWYNHNAKQLSSELEDYLKLAKKQFSVPATPASVKAILVPHAGYYYSGLCAATAYQTIQSADIKRVIILAPSHTTFMHGIALPPYTTYRTVFGDVPVDTKAVRLLGKRVFFKGPLEAHLKEHAIEIQLPYLQKILKDFTIVPLIVGELKDDKAFEVAHELKKIIDDKTLIVISSDFLHHGKAYDYDYFNKHILDHVRLVDSLGVQAITVQSFPAFHQMLEQTNASICGREPIKVLLALLDLQMLGPVEAQVGCYYASPNIVHAHRPVNGTIDCAKLSEPISDDKASSSVSYVSMVFSTDKQNALTGYEEKALLTMSRRILNNVFKKDDEKIPEQLLQPLITPGLDQRKGAFVTLKTKANLLRGCIGHIFSNEPLYKTVASMTIQAAFHDSRFAPLTKEELDNVRIEISVLEQPRPVESYKDIQIGKHGIVLHKLTPDKKSVFKSAVFLPQVATEQGWGLEQTLQELCLKVGLDHDAWQINCKFDVFEGHEIKE